CYFNIEDLPNAIRFLHKCENAGKKHSADEAFLFSTYTSLGQCYSFAGEHKKALDYFEKAYAIESDDTQLNEWIEKLREIVDVGGNSKN
ncbi:MAG: tetratricopeptide repeat protein, partial [Calditrichaeota bacterium]